MKNRVAKLVAIKKIELFEEDVPSLREGELLVEMKAAGICGSDRHYFLHGGLGSFKQLLPMYMGHEPSGVVIDANGSPNFKTGDRVAIEPARHCNDCEWCVRGQYNLCLKSEFMGANAPGAFADYIVIHEKQAEKIPDSMSFEMAALMEPLGVALHAFNLIKPTPQESVIIFGCGSIGLSMLYLLKKSGFNKIYMIDRLKYRAEFAERFGATKSFAVEEDYLAEIKKLTLGKGTQLSIDAAGDELSINGCIQTASINGKVLLIGIPEDDYVPFNPHKMRIKQLVLQNVRRSNQTLADCLSIVGEDKKLLDVVSHRFKLDDIQKAFETVANYSDNVLKCMLTKN